MKNNYIEQDQQLFNDIIQRNYYSLFQKGQGAIEFFLNGYCRSNCEYCYLKQHQNELFPKELYNKEQIILNTELLIKWYIDNNFTCPINIFSGEWLTTELAEPILDLFYNYFKDLYNYQKPKKIVAPDNMNFINDKKLTNKIQNYIDKFKKIGIQFYISASIDGAKCDFGRTQQNEDFYIKCFNFLSKNKFLCHPMISSNNIKYWKENYLWWVNNAPDYITESLMMLEVRDETWTDESICDLLNFCDFLIDFKLEHFFNNDLIQFSKYIFKSNANKILNQYSPELLQIHSFMNDMDGSTCSFSNTLFIRVPDLTLGLCHRLYYEDLILGELQINNETKEIDNTLLMRNNSIPLLITKKFFKRSCMPHCESCIFEPICNGFCCGNSYENYKNILVPTMETCQMYKAKYTFLLEKYNKLGIFDLIESDKINFLSDLEKKYILNLKNQLLFFV